MATIQNIHKDGKSFPMGTTHARVIVSPETGARHVTFNYIRYEPGAEFPQHLHDHSEDVFLVLEGSGWLREGDRRTPIGPGDVIFVPPGEVHGTVAGPQGMVVISCQGPPDAKLYTGERDSSRKPAAPVSDRPQALEEVLIRPATPADLPAIVAMRDDLNDLERAGCPHAAIQRMTLEEFTSVWGATLHSPAHCWQIVEVEGQPVGFGLIYVVFPQTRSPGAFIQWAYLKPACRGQGVGHALLEHMLAWARAQGAKRVELQFIDGNEVAEQFWGKMGFRPYARKCVRSLGDGGV